MTNDNNINENKIIDTIRQGLNIRKFIEGIKAGGKETKESFLLLKNHIVNGVELSDEDKKKITNNLIKILKGAATISIPGGITFTILFKTLKPLFKKSKNMVNEDKIKGGKADNMSVEDIANKFGVTVTKINKELEMGIEVEMEHTKSKKLAKEIAMDHLSEMPDYYTRLKKMEKEAEKHWKKREKKVDESIREFITDLVRMNLKD